jgi:hypothetical protein
MTKKCSCSGGLFQTIKGGCGCNTPKIFKAGYKKKTTKKNKRKRRKTFRGGQYADVPSIVSNNYTYPFNTSSGGSHDPSSPFNTMSTHL